MADLRSLLQAGQLNQIPSVGMDIGREVQEAGPGMTAPKGGFSLFLNDLAINPQAVYENIKNYMGEWRGVEQPAPAVPGGGMLTDEVDPIQTNLDRKRKELEGLKNDI